MVLDRFRYRIVYSKDISINYVNHREVALNFNLKCAVKFCKTLSLQISTFYTWEHKSNSFYDFPKVKF